MGAFAVTPRFACNHGSPLGGVVTLEIRGRVLGTDSTLNRGFRAPGGLWVQKRFGGSLGRCSAGPLQAAVRVRHGPLFPGRLMARHAVLVRVIEVRVLAGEPLIHTSPPISVGAGVLLPLFVKLFCTSSTFISTAEQRTLNPQVPGSSPGGRTKNQMVTMSRPPLD